VDAMMYFIHNVEASEIGSFANIGLGKDISIHDLAFMIKNLVGFTGEIVFDPTKPDGMPRKLMDVRRAAHLGWRARISIPDGVRLTYDWYLQNLAREAAEL
jgi:GDP-L-fucose synthase